MAVVGVAVAFGSVMFLVSKRVALWLALLAGTGLLGLLSQMGLLSFTTALADGLLSPMTIQLVVAVALISGNGQGYEGKRRPRADGELHGGPVSQAQSADYASARPHWHHQCARRRHYVRPHGRRKREGARPGQRSPGGGQPVFPAYRLLHLPPAHIADRPQRALGHPQTGNYPRQCTANARGYSRCLSVLLQGSSPTIHSAPKRY
jgi:hypothetical protein